MSEADLRALAPSLLLAASGILAGLLGSRIRGRRLAWLGAVAALGATVSAIALGPPTAAAATGSGGAVVRDGAAIFFVSLIGVVAAVLMALAAAAPARGGLTDEVALLLFAASGAALVVAAADVLVLLVGLSLVTIPLYVLTGRTLAPRGDEPAIRHALLGGASTAVALYGVALLYVATGATGYAGLGRATHNPLYLAGLALALAGIGSHVVLAPAHRWSILITVAAAGAVVRLAAVTRSGEAALDWQVSLATIGALAMVSAAVAPLAERRLRWLVGYATISQLGFVAVATASAAAPAAALGLAAYGLTAVGLFGILALLPSGEPVLADLAGFARRRPLVVVALGLLALELLGLPPTVGFIARLYIFEAAVRAQLLWLVVLGALATVAGAAIYARLVLACFAAPPLHAVAPSRARVATAVTLIAALAVVAGGVVPGPLLDAAQLVRF